MSNYSSLYGAGGVPIGAIVQGQFAADASYLPCDGRDYLSASYPLLDKTSLSTFGTNVVGQITPGGAAAISSLASNGTIIVACYSGQQQAVLTSSDTATWTSRTLPTLGTIYSIRWLNSLFVATMISSTGSYFTVLTSPDGITWTQRYQDTSTAFTIISAGTPAVTYGAGLFVAVVPGSGSPSATGSYFTSPDGITWTKRTSLPTQQWWGVFFIDNEFLAFPRSADGGGSQTQLFAKSVDGLTWTSYYLPTVGAFWSTFVLNNVVHISNGSGYWKSSSRGLSWQSLPSGSVRPSTQINGYMFDNSGLYWRENSPTPYNRLPVSYNTSLGEAVLLGSRVIISNTGASGAFYYIDFDSSKFKTPLAVPTLDTDRYYIKAK